MVYNNLEKQRKHGRDYYTRNKERVKEYIKRAKLKHRYGITEEDYNSMFDEQFGCCKICNRHQTILKSKLEVDHDHSDGKVRGLLCHNCNMGLGAFADNPDVLLKAREYLL